MNCTQLQELAAAYALGALEAPEAAHLEAMAASDPEIRMEVDAFLAVTASLLRDLPAVPPPPRVRDRVLARIRELPRQQPPTAPIPQVPSFSEGFRFLRPASGEWSEGLHPGTRLQVLASNVRRNYMMLYIELDPGAVYPSHEHSGAEELFVVKGDLVTEGRHLQAGDFVHADPGTHHHDLVSPSGCQAILITPLTSALAEIAKAKVRKTADRVRETLGLGGK
ncbi:MAG: cupin domain-containing protein [Verrucomicrobiales bacterium]|nr:cupin domain-containing protein [Verrucomicrobiales bacterium]